jgi:hypothetical protein
LENYDPNSPADPFKWIPKGLMEDLIDNTPNEVLVNDQVYGYTIGALFAALQSDVTSLQQYKARLLQQNNNYQQVQTNDLFTSYHY